jgi:hypothetical protein
MIMPPKSTWFEPKPRDGFLIRCFEWVLMMSLKYLISKSTLIIFTY